MIEQIIKGFDTKITATGWIERYGGLVRTITKGFPVDEGVVYKSFPVSCGVTAKECWEKGKYQNLVPDDKYKSIAYWEQRGPVSCQKSTRVSADLYLNEFSAPVSFICWLNMPKLGFDDCGNSHLFEAQMLKILTTGSVFITDPPYDIMELSVVIDGVAPKNETIFTKYSYEDRTHLLMYPFDFFSVNLTFKWKVNLCAVPDVTLGEPVICNKF